MTWTRMLTYLVCIPHDFAKIPRHPPRHSPPHPPPHPLPPCFFRAPRPRLTVPASIIRGDQDQVQSLLSQIQGRVRGPAESGLRRARFRPFPSLLLAGMSFVCLCLLACLLVYFVFSLGGGGGEKCIHLFGGGLQLATFFEAIPRVGKSCSRYRKFCNLNQLVVGALANFL